MSASVPELQNNSFGSSNQEAPIENQSAQTPSDAIKHQSAATEARENQIAATQNQSAPIENQSAPPEVALTQMITGSLGSQAVYVAAQLGIADLLVDGPKNADTLAQEAGADAPSLYRVLRALSSFGVFKELKDQTFALTATGELLRSDSPRSLRDLAIFMGEDWHWQVWGRTLYSVAEKARQSRIQ